MDETQIGTWLGRILKYGLLIGIGYYAGKKIIKKTKKNQTNEAAQDNPKHPQPRNHLNPKNQN